jgi:creatinine amidohydrolase
MMHYHPELVNLEEAGSGDATPFALQSLRDKTAWLPRHWTRVTADTGIGNPHLSTPEKGRRFAEAVARKYAVLLKELAAVQNEQDFYTNSPS